MESPLQGDSISNVIQLAVAPVFLLASISGALNVLSLRMGRIIDRGRVLNDRQCAELSPEAAEVEFEQRLLAKRARLTNRAIGFCVMSALFVCLVIVALFLDALFALELDSLIAFLFVVALLSLIVALVSFLREVEKSLTAFRFGRFRAADRHSRP